MRFELEKKGIGFSVIFKHKIPFINKDGLAFFLIPPKGMPWYVWLGVPFIYTKKD